MVSQKVHIWPCLSFKDKVGATNIKLPISCVLIFLLLSVGDQRLQILWYLHQHYCFLHYFVWWIFSCIWLQMGIYLAFHTAGDSWLAAVVLFSMFFTYKQDKISFTNSGKGFIFQCSKDWISTPPIHGWHHFTTLACLPTRGGSVHLYVCFTIHFNLLLV